MLNLFLLFLFLFFVVKSANFATKYAVILAHVFHLPKYVVGFLVVAVISILPETFIFFNSTLQGVPAFGLGTIFGSNVADLTLIFAIVIFSTFREIKVSSKTLENNKWYPFLLALPIFVGLDGYYSRIEGVALIIAGIFFYYWTFKINHHKPLPLEKHTHHQYKNFLFLVLSLSVLLLSSHFTVKFAVVFAESININPILIGMLIVGLGTTLPELFFSLKAIKQGGDDLALGDILGTVISDATIVIGLIALINPFSFPQKIIFSTAIFMVLASLILFKFMRSGKVITKKEGFLLFLFYALFVVVEYLISM